MAELFVFLAIVIGFVLSSITIWSRKNTWLRSASVFLWLALIPAAIGSYVFALSYPGPLTIVPGGEYVLLGSKLVQDEAIYIYLDFGKGEPRSFALPWDNETAEKIRKLKEGEKKGDIQGVLGRFPLFEFSWERRKAPMFYPMPQSIIPIPKGTPEVAPDFRETD